MKEEWNFHHLPRWVTHMCALGYGFGHTVSPTSHKCLRCGKKLPNSVKMILELWRSDLTL